VVLGGEGDPGDQGEQVADGHAGSHRAGFRRPPDERLTGCGQACGGAVLAGNTRIGDPVAVQGLGQPAGDRRERRAVFSWQMPEAGAGGFDFDGELRQAANLIDAVRTAGVPQFVHSSVSGASRYRSAPGHTEGRWAALEPYYVAKTGVEGRVREAGFPFWTLVKPGFFMENFLTSAACLLPRGVAGDIVTVVRPQTRLSLVAVDDIGATVAAAVADRSRFHEVELELASDYRTMTEIAATLSRVLGVELTAPDMSEEEALAAGMPAYAGLPMERMNVAGQPARPEFARALGVPLTSFDRWAARHMK
jgi:uncharacterized protein YbjT (DUF2867 family)